MFCPKCGTQNPETGRFCRSCGTDLENVSEALAGKSSRKSSGFGLIEPIQPLYPVNQKGKPVNWEGAIGKLFMGAAFFVVSIVLAVSGRGSNWWFWLLIPAFAMLGSGVAQLIQLRKSERQAISGAQQNAPNIISAAAQNPALPPTQTEYVAPDSRYKTGDLIPPSVTDGTTRHLEMNSEGETMTLPKK